MTTYIRLCLHYNIVLYYIRTTSCVVSSRLLVYSTAVTDMSPPYNYCIKVDVYKLT